MDKFYCMHCGEPIYQYKGDINGNFMVDGLKVEWTHEIYWGCWSKQNDRMYDSNGEPLFAEPSSTKKESITPTQNTINTTVNVNIVVFEQPKGRKFKNIV